MNRATGLLVIEVINSNPNGNPDQDSDPRQRPDERGMISPVSFKRKLRDLVEDKDSPVWPTISSSFSPALASDAFQILESRGRKRDEIRKMKPEDFRKTYWDARLFGSTFLEKSEVKGQDVSFIHTGVAQFGMGVSISPVRIERQTNTNKAGVEADKDRGLAPLAYRVVQHGVYTMPYFINAAVANKSGCMDLDIELMKKLMPHAYKQTASAVRPQVILRHAWHIEHNGPLGSCPDFALLDALTPTRKQGAVGSIEEPSTSWADYNVPSALPEALASRVKSVVDLVIV
jgi:Cas7 group CRISPR-associated protein Csh2